MLVLCLPLMGSSHTLAAASTLSRRFATGLSRWSTCKYLSHNGIKLVSDMTTQGRHYYYVHRIWMGDSARVEMGGAYFSVAPDFRFREHIRYLSNVMRQAK